MSTLEDMFKDKFDDFKPEPPQSNWTNIDRKLSWRKFLSFSPKTFNIYYTAATIATLGYLGFQQNYPVEKNVNDTDTTEVFDNEISVSNPLTDTSNDNSRVMSQHQNNSKNVNVSDSNDRNNFETNQDNHSSTIPTNDNQNHYGEDTSISYDTSDKAPQSKVKTEPKDTNIYSSTSPINNSNNHNTETPKATIAHAIQGMTAIMEARCNAANATFTWNFGDGGRGIGKRVAHEYKNPGNYQISLIVTSGSNRDTTTVNVTIKTPEFSLKFPNAQVASMSSTPFAPKGNINELSKYSMVIYRRNGQEIFRTNNPSEGWHGMLNGERLPKGVYAYKVSYEFINGEKNFKTGSITLLWEENTNLSIHQ